jgi:hypothetical protein
MKCSIHNRSRNAVATLTIVFALPLASWGNVYPTNLDQSADSFNPSAAESVALSYLLNEDATNVSIDILNSSNAVVRTLSGPVTTGLQTVLWDGTDNSSTLLPDGDYSFRVNTIGNARADWEQISIDSPLNSFFVPRGVAVNKNPNSPYYGRVYAAESRGGTPGVAPVRGAATADGVYMLNADLTDTGIAGGSGPYAGGIPWRNSASTPPEGTTTPPSPFRLEVGPDDSVYVTDWSDQNSGVYQAPPDLTGTFVEVLDSTGRAASGLNATHGSISDLIVTGTGDSRTIYTIDEDFIPVAGTTSTGSVLRYDIGSATTFTGAPSGFAYQDGFGTDTAVNRIQNFVNSIAQDEEGNIWLSQVRSTVPAPTDTLTSLVQINSSGTVVWSSVPDLAATTANDPLRGTQAIAYDPVNNLFALATNQTGGAVLLFDPITKTIIDQFNFGNTTNTDIAFDAAGNLYVNNRSGERLRVWSPPNTVGFVANEFSTASLGPLGTLAISSVPVGQPGDHNEDGVVDAADYVAWRKLNIDGQDGYDDFFENFGEPAAGGGSGSVPEPNTFVLCVLIGLMGTYGCRRRG